MFDIEGIGHHITATIRHKEQFQTAGVGIGVVIVLNVANDIIDLYEGMGVWGCEGARV